MMKLFRYEKISDFGDEHNLVIGKLKRYNIIRLSLQTYFEFPNDHVSLHISLGGLPLFSFEMNLPVFCISLIILERNYGNS
jgi:hypothetical protein